MSGSDPRPLVAHVVYRFDVGGLENGVVNLINHMPAESYRHAVVALTSIGDFRKRIGRDDVGFFALDKPPGHALRIYPQLYRLFSEMQPSIVHSRNLAALEIVVPAWAAGVPVRIHGEHGRDVSDVDGSSRKYQWVRRAYRPFVSRYVALSKDLEAYLEDRVGIPSPRIAQIYNGVDTRRFHPAGVTRPAITGCPFADPELWLIGTVGRMQTIKDQTNLAHAFVRALQLRPELAARMRLVLIGDGPLRAEVKTILDTAECGHLAWLPGEREDIPEILRGLDCFVLPSLAEGISNTILEAMATGLPVVATDVGGNRELVVAGTTGELVGPADPAGMAAAIVAYAADRGRARAAGGAGRATVEARFSIEAMVGRYRRLYDLTLQARGTS